MTQFNQNRPLSPEAIDASIKRGRELRSQAVTEMMGALFGSNTKGKRHVRG